MQQMDLDLDDEEEEHIAVAAAAAAGAAAAAASFLPLGLKSLKRPHSDTLRVADGEDDDGDDLDEDDAVHVGLDERNGALKCHRCGTTKDVKRDPGAILNLPNVPPLCKTHYLEWREEQSAKAGEHLASVWVPTPTATTKPNNVQAIVPDKKRCAYCNTASTPQWRQGPGGAKSLCNACGVRYKAGRLDTSSLTPARAAQADSPPPSPLAEAAAASGGGGGDENAGTIAKPPAISKLAANNEETDTGPWFPSEFVLRFGSKAVGMCVDIWWNDKDPACCAWYVAEVEEVVEPQSPENYRTVRVRYPLDDVVEILDKTAQISLQQHPARLGECTSCAQVIYLKEGEESKKHIAWCLSRQLCRRCYNKMHSAKHFPQRSFTKTKRRKETNALASLDKLAGLASVAGNATAAKSAAIRVQPSRVAHGMQNGGSGPSPVGKSTVASTHSGAKAKPENEGDAKLKMKTIVQPKPPLVKAEAKAKGGDVKFEMTSPIPGFEPPTSLDDFKSKSLKLKALVDEGILSRSVFEKWQASCLGVNL